MIFPMRPARLASFWMKDTPSPLDIIFIAPGGTVARIAAMTKPYSLDPIDSGVAVEAVLEIAGGRAEQIGLTPGDRVDWPNPGGESGSSPSRAGQVPQTRVGRRDTHQWVKKKQAGG